MGSSVRYLVLVDLYEGSGDAVGYHNRGLVYADAWRALQVPDFQVGSAGTTFVSTDSHANIMGAVGAFGQGMGDVDIAQAFAFGKVWFKVPPTVKVVLRGTPSPRATAKDITLAMSYNYSDWIEAYGMQTHSTRFSVQEFIQQPEIQGHLWQIPQNVYAGYPPRRRRRYG